MEQAKKGLNLSLSDTIKDHDVLEYIISAQAFFESYTRRKLDGELSQIEYFDGVGQRSQNLKNFPLRSITELAIDNGHDWASSSVVSSDDYWAEDEAGLLWLKGDIDALGSSPGFPVGQNNCRVTYRGGWIAEKTIVALASPSASHTISDSLSSYGQDFQVFVKTTGTFSAAGTISITGLDENGTSHTELVTPYATDLTSGKSTFSFTRAKFSSITSVDSSACTTSTNGKVALSAVSTPADVRLALSRLCAHWYRQDALNQINVRSRSMESASETYGPEEIPKNITEILDLYRSVII